MKTKRVVTMAIGLLAVLVFFGMGTGYISAYADGAPVITTTDKIVVIGQDNEFVIEASGV